jgi:hypothetical protein
MTYNIHKTKFETTELEHLKEFTNIIKQMYPSLQFEVIYITTKEATQYINDNNILIINSPLSLKWHNKNGINWSNCDNKIKELFDKNMSYIVKYILKDNYLSNNVSLFDKSNLLLHKFNNKKILKYKKY